MIGLVSNFTFKWVSILPFRLLGCFNAFSLRVRSQYIQKLDLDFTPCSLKKILSGSMRSCQYCYPLHAHASIPCQNNCEYPTLPEKLNQHPSRGNVIGLHGWKAESLPDSNARIKLQRTSRAIMCTGILFTKARVRSTSCMAAAIVVRIRTK